jgi:hypothetical protein
MFVFTIEEIDKVIANEGDIVSMPPFAWHAPHSWSDGPSKRLGFKGYPIIARLREAH